jgi:hypothetical protein
MPEQMPREASPDPRRGRTFQVDCDRHDAVKRDAHGPPGLVAAEAGEVDEIGIAVRARQFRCVFFEKAGTLCVGLRDLAVGHVFTLSIPGKRSSRKLETGPPTSQSLCVARSDGREGPFDLVREFGEPPGGRMGVREVSHDGEQMASALIAQSCSHGISAVGLLS